MVTDPSERGTAVKTALDHSWAWFTLHATQRLQSVNFYLIAVAFLSAGFVAAAKEKMHAIAAVVAALGVCLSFFFYRMERRIRSLVHASEEALIPLQAELAEMLGVDAVNMVAKVEDAKPGEWKYSRVFRCLYFTTGIAFLFGLIYVTWSWAMNVPQATEFKIIIQAILGIFIMFMGNDLLVSVPPAKNGEAFQIASLWANFVIGGISFLVGLGVLVHLVFTRLP